MKRKSKKFTTAAAALALTILSCLPQGAALLTATTAALLSSPVLAQTSLPIVRRTGIPRIRLPEPESSQTFIVGVTVSGLPNGESVTLQNNGANSLSITANGAATFANGASGPYAVTVAIQPANATCQVTGGAGIATVNTSGIPVVCEVNRFALVPKSGVGFYDPSECVIDIRTRLVWEGKSAAGPRAGGNRYTNFDDVNQSQNGATAQSAIPPTLAQINSATNSIGYRDMVNSQQLCGKEDWRLPTLSELSSMHQASGGKGTITSNAWLPNSGNVLSGNGPYWTATPPSSGAHAGYGWVVAFNSPPFIGNYGFRYGLYQVRLVR
ncbi:hypothetical protein BH11PSE14_BH11PSE14_12190 [soil metagenome]